MKVFAWIVARIQEYRSKRITGVTVKYMFPAVLGTVLLLSASTISSSSESYVFLSSDTRTVEVGELVLVEIGVSAHVPINAVDITIDFPADKLEIFSIDRGQSVLTIWTEDPIISRNAVQLIGGTFKRGFIGTHEIAVIKFRAIKAGQYEVQTDAVTFIAGDGTGAKVQAHAKPVNTLALFSFDENTSSKEIQVAIAAGITTDLNNDGRVTLQDISAFMGAWNTKKQLFDFDNDGRMTFKDFSIILADFFFR